MRLPKFMSAETVTLNVGWFYLAAVVELVQLVIIFHLG